MHPDLAHRFHDGIRDAAGRAFGADSEGLEPLSAFENFVYGFKGNICPQGYIAIPHLRVSFETGLADPRGYTLRSGPLYTAHADFMNGWRQADLDAQLRNAGVIQ